MVERWLGALGSGFCRWQLGASFISVAALTAAIAPGRSLGPTAPGLSLLGPTAPGLSLLGPTAPGLSLLGPTAPMPLVGAAFTAATRLGSFVCLNLLGLGIVAAAAAAATAPPSPSAFRSAASSLAVSLSFHSLEAPLEGFSRRLARFAPKRIQAAHSGRAWRA